MLRLKSLPVAENIRSLYLGNTLDEYVDTPVTDKCLDLIVKFCPHLQDLILFQVGFYPSIDDVNDINGKCIYTNDGIRNILTQLSNSLRRLELGGNWRRKYSSSELNFTMFPRDIVNTSLREVCLGNLKRTCDEGP